MTSSSASAASHPSDAAYAEAMHAILTSEPLRGLVTEPTRLLPHVFIGSQSNAEDLTTMRRLGISHVLNCAGYKGPRPSANASPYDGLGIEYHEFKVHYLRFQPCSLFYCCCLVVGRVVYAPYWHDLSINIFLSNRASPQNLVKNLLLVCSEKKPLFTRSRHCKWGGKFCDVHREFYY